MRHPIFMLTPMVALAGCLSPPEPEVVPLPPVPTGQPLQYSANSPNEYNQYCAACHYDGSIGQSLTSQAMKDKWSHQDLAVLTTKVRSMLTPSCDQDCKDNLSNYLWYGVWQFSDAADINPTPAVSTTLAPTVGPTATAVPTVAPSVSASLVPTATPAVTVTTSVVPSISASLVPTATATPLPSQVVTPSISSTATPTVTSVPSPTAEVCTIAPYVPGMGYQDGDQVLFKGQVYECIDGPYPYCSSDKTSYFAPDGIFGDITWEPKGACSGAIVTPTPPSTTATATPSPSTTPTPTVTPSPEIMPPTAPANLVAQLIGNEVRLSWQLPLARETTQFVLRQKQGESDWQLVASFKDGSLNWTDALTDSGTYRYRVYASNLAGNSDYSNEVQVSYVSAEQAQFEQNCQLCHRDGGIAVPLLTQPLADKWQGAGWQALVDKVAVMPVAQCDSDCKTKMAEFLWTQGWGLSLSNGVESQDLGVRGVRLLTPIEYQRSVYALTGVWVADADLPDYKFDSTFKYPTDADAGQVVYDDLVTYMGLAQGVAAQTDFAALNCNASGCQNLADLLLQFFRRPASASETSAWQGYMNEYGSEALMTALLLTPEFLYRTELGTWDASEQAYRLTPFELVTAASMQFLGRTPDLALLKRAIRGEFATKAALVALGEELLQRQEANEYAQEFIRFYSHSVELPAEKPGLSANVVRAMEQERELMLTDWFAQGATLTELFTPGWTYLNQTLAQHYGIAGVNGDQMRKVQVDDRRGGLLHQGLLQVVNSDFAATSLVKRGKMVREHMLCHQMGIPSGVDPNAVQLPTHAITTKERWQVITGPDASKGQCWACHKLMNEPGSALEEFDQTGRHRLTEQAFNDLSVQLPIDSSGVVRSHDGLSIWSQYENSRDLANFVAQSHQGQRCFSDSYMRFATGQRSDDLSYQDRQWLAEQFQIDPNLKSLMVNTLTLHSFMYRSDRSQ